MVSTTYKLTTSLTIAIKVLKQCSTKVIDTKHSILWRYRHSVRCQFVSTPLSVCFRSASSLLPVCFQVLPVCFQVLPVCFQSSSSPLLFCFQSASSKVTRKFQFLCAVLMNWEVGWAVIAQIVKVAHQTLHSSIRVNWEFSSNCGFQSASILLSVPFQSASSPLPV